MLRLAGWNYPKILQFGMKDDQIVIGTINGLLWGMFHTTGALPMERWISLLWLPTYQSLTRYLSGRFLKKQTTSAWRMASNSDTQNGHGFNHHLALILGFRYSSAKLWFVKLK